MTAARTRTIQVNDLATAEEVAAVLAALDAALHVSHPSPGNDQSGYERWRHTRLNALRAD